MLATVLHGLLLLTPAICGRQLSRLETVLIVDNVVGGENTTKSLNVSSCPGYTLTSLSETTHGLTAKLNLAGPPCNAFGQDVSNLTIQVTYETRTRLHVNIFDTDNKQFTIPDSVIARPPTPSTSHTKTSDLVFHYDSSPFAFWISRRSEPHAAPLFDTRIASLPQTPIPPSSDDNRTALDGFPLVFEDQYLQLTSALPKGTNIYGLGEVVSSSGFRRAIGTNGDNGTIQTMWARDIADPIDQNLYGSHPIYLEHRFNQSTNKSQSHGVFLFSSAGADIMLLTPASASTSLIEYRLIGGTLDFYFFSGPTPQSVIEQYGGVVGLPTWQPAWAFGFQLCRWGYHDINETKEQVQKMREADIPLEVMWNDIDLYHALRDFTSDPVTFPANEMRAFIGQLHANHQHYVPIVDAALAKQVNATDIYNPYIKGVEQKVFMTNPNGTEYVGQVWPGYTVFPDWFAHNTQSWWTEAFRNWSSSGITFDGIWLDMNEASSFCDGSCGTGANLSNTTVPKFLPGSPENPVTAYPECYNSTISGPSGNMTVNSTSTYACDSTHSSSITLSRRGIGAGNQSGVDLNAPPYPIHNGNGRLAIHALATNATHAGGYAELDVHNLWGMMEEKATHKAVQEVLPGKRPFLISRSTFPGSGNWSGHWLGDNFNPFRGDTCGFNGNTDEELCNRWMQLSAFAPFYRNHNERAALSQEPYRWDSVANASRTAIATRYSLLPYWYTLFANASTFGTPPVRALFFEFPDEPELFSVDRQFLIGRDILITPVLTPNASTVDGIFPGRGSVVWRDWYTHDIVNATSGANTTLPAPLGHINVHVRDGSAILLHSQPTYTIEQTRQGPFSLLVSLSADSQAFGTAFVDDGISNPPGSSTTLSITGSKGQLRIQAKGTFNIKRPLQDITILGVKRPTKVIFQDETAKNWIHVEAQDKLVVSKINGDLNSAISLKWE